MGKGDKKTKKGKIFAGSSGNVRPKHKKELGVREKSENAEKLVQTGKLKAEKIVKEIKPKVQKVVKETKPKAEKNPQEKKVE